MTFRDYLRELHPQVGEYIAQLCRLKVGDEAFGPDIHGLYGLYKQYGLSEFVAACALATTEGAFGACYLEAILRPALEKPAVGLLHPRTHVPDQEEVDRELFSYEQYTVGGVE